MIRHPIRVLTTGGLDYLADLDDRDATSVGRHWNAVRRYLETGHDDDLADFDNIAVTGRDEAGAVRTARLETDLDAIDRLAVRGEVRFESIYDEVQ